MFLKLRVARLVGSCSLDDLSKLAVVDRGAISKMERGLYPHATNVGEKVARTLGVPQEWLFDGVDVA